MQNTCVALGYNEDISHLFSDEIDCCFFNIRMWRTIMEKVS